jgi:hypothetical protein
MLNELNKLFFNLIWDGKTERNTLIGDILYQEKDIRSYLLRYMVLPSADY